MKREEAIEIIRDTYHTDIELQALEVLIPELKESEDEEIRSSLLEFLDDVWHMGKNANFDRWGKADCADWIAYLEKQKEPHYTKRNALFDKCVENCDPEVMKRVSDEVDEMLEKEQKQSLSEKIRPIFPAVADFVDSVDNMEKNRAIRILEDYLKWAVSSEEECRYTWKELADAIQLGINAMKEQKPAEWGEDIIRKAIKEVGLTQHQIDWFKTNVFPPKQEWSEEDKGFLLDVKCVIDEVLHSTSDINTGYTKEELKEMWQWLDGIWQRVEYPEDKAEWGEKDEETLNNILYILNQLKDTTVHKEDKTAEKCISWLKSLRPSWKPSEDQMEALKEVAYNIVGTGTETDVHLVQLYEQLKKF